MSQERLLLASRRFENRRYSVFRLKRRRFPVLRWQKTTRIVQLLYAGPRPFSWPVRLLVRARIVIGYLGPRLKNGFRWIFRDTETSNFNYQLSELNRQQLAHFVAVITKTSHAQVLAFFAELEGDSHLRRHLQRSLRESGQPSQIQVEFGRRLGWYAFTRIMKPRVVIETGVDHGVGACVLASALLRNVAEGFPGVYVGTEIRTDAGQLLAGPYAKVGRIIYGDSITTLNAFQDRIDLFINDSDHSADYEYNEYLSIASKLSDSALVIGDNSHVTNKLAEWSVENGRKFLFFSEKPQEHWYPGAGIGVSFP